MALVGIGGTGVCRVSGELMTGNSGFRKGACVGWLECVIS